MDFSRWVWLSRSMSGRRDCSRPGNRIRHPCHSRVGTGSDGSGRYVSSQTKVNGLRMLSILVSIRISCG